MGMIQKAPGPRRPINLPSRNTTAFSHWLATFREKRIYSPMPVKITIGAELTQSENPRVLNAMVPRSPTPKSTMKIVSEMLLTVLACNAARAGSNLALFFDWIVIGPPNGSK
jgi:hypothetical protein